jgi:hypothetical protein
MKKKKETEKMNSKLEKELKEAEKTMSSKSQAKSQTKSSKSKKKSAKAESVKGDQELFENMVSQKGDEQEILDNKLAQAKAVPDA